MIIGLGHKKQQGKSTVAKILREKYGFVEYTFAKRLKDIVDLAFNFDPYYKQHKEELCNGISYRDACENIGQYFRNTFGSDFWIKVLEKDVLDWNKDIVISDVRHMEEVNFIKQRSGKLVKIINRNKTTINKSNHISENGLDEFKGWDYTIFNEKGLGELENSVNSTLQFLDYKLA